MVFKKPYAFLIKNFKIIHLILATIVFLVILTYRDVNKFFNTNVTNPITGFRLAESYISPFLYLTIFLIIIFAGMMTWLMLKKKKPALFYIITLSFYILFLIMILFAASVMNSLDGQTLTQQTSRAYRDIFFILSLPHYYFLIQSIIRGMGFDVKQFNFSKDLAQLEISSEDDAEFEFVLGTNTYKYERKLRRTLREITYYIKENKFILSILAGVIILIIGAYTINNINFVNLIHRIRGGGTMNGMEYKINSSYVTEYDFNGQLIKENFKYIIVDITVKNTTSRARELTNIDWYFVYGKNQVYHSPHVRNNFIDMGLGYANESILPNSTRNLTLVFEVPKKANVRSAELHILREITVGEDRQSTYNYSPLRLRPKTLNNQPSRVQKKLYEQISLGERFYGDSTLTITNVEIMTNYKYQYESCKNNVCNQLYEIVSPKDPLNQRLIVVGYELNIDKNMPISNIIVSDKYFFDRYLKIEYLHTGATRQNSLTVKTVQSLPNLLFIEVPIAILNDNKLNLILQTREFHNYIDLLNLNN